MKNTVYCPTCGRAALVVQDERTGRVGYSCRERTCPGSRSLIDTEYGASQEPEA